MDLFVKENSMHRPIRFIFVILLLLLSITNLASAVERRNQPYKYQPWNGDIVFQTSKSQLGPAIEAATGSKITHCGVTFRENDTMFVYEAVGPVRKVPLSDWIHFGVNDRLIVKRLRNVKDTLSPKVIEKMLKIYREFEGRDYDINFEWSDDKMYCSELVYKMFKRGAGIELGRFEQFGDFHLDNPLVQFWIKQYFPKGPNLKEKVVSPVSILNDTSLVTIYSNY